MNYAIKTTITAALVLILNSLAFGASDNDLNKTIILVNGVPFFVEMNENGNQIEKIATVPTYFTSNETHNEILDKVSSDYEDEYDNIKSRLLIFPEEQAMLDQVAVDHIRDLARLYTKGYIQSINISAAHLDNNIDEALAAHRISSVYQMLKDFGIEDEGITADMKQYRSDLPNVFVQLKIKK